MFEPDKSSDFIGVGAINLDAEFLTRREHEKGLSRFVEKGGEAFVREDTSEKYLFDEFLVENNLEPRDKKTGGSALNTTIGVAKTGKKAKFFGVVGDDDYGKEMVDYIGNNRVDTSSIKTLPGSSGVCHCFIHEDNERSMVVVTGVNDYMKEHPSFKLLTRHTKMIHFSSVLMLNRLDSIITYNAMADDAKRYGIDVSITPTGFWAQILGQPQKFGGKKYELVKRLVTGSTIVHVNDDELRTIMGNGETSIMRSARGFIRKYDVRLLSVTRGAEGSEVFERDGDHYHIDAPNVEPSYQLGTGDAYAGGFAAQYIEDNSNPRKCGLAGAYFAASKLTSGFSATGYPIDIMEMRRKLA